VRQIVKLSNGRLGVRSKVGQGSTFWVELPLGVGEKTIRPYHPLQSTPDQNSGTFVSENVIAMDGSESSGRLQKGDSSFKAPSATIRKATEAPSVPSRSSPAWDCLMDQGMLRLHPEICSDILLAGGRVDLVLTQHESRSTLPHCPLSVPFDDSAGQASAIVTAQPSLLPDDSSTSDGIPKPHMRRRPRPTHVPLPKPPTFPTTDIRQRPGSPRSPGHSPDSLLTQFDTSFSRLSPSASCPVLNIEPGLPVLVVDDDPLTRTLMKKVLTRLGCHVSTAENGEVALGMILGPHVAAPSTDASRALEPILEPQDGDEEPYPVGKYAVVFLDNQMPVLSGIKTVQRIRELGRKDLIVGVTGSCLST